MNLQKEFLPSLPDCQSLIDSNVWLLDVAQTFNIVSSVIYHIKLGETLPSIEKMSTHSTIFETYELSIVKETSILEHVKNSNKEQIILSGPETHISILQTALDLKMMNYDVLVVIDACSSRNIIDHQYGIDRLKQNNVTLITKEMLFFELLQRSNYPNYIDHSLKFLDRRYIREF